MHICMEARYVVIFLCFVFSRQGLCVPLAVLILALQIRLASNSTRSACLCLPSAEIKGTCHHPLLDIFFYHP